MKKEVYNRLPAQVKPVVKNVYTAVFGSTDASVEDTYLQLLFNNRNQFEKYIDEFDKSIANIQSDRMDEFYELIPEKQATFGGMDIDQARLLYAIVRSQQPEIMVETGVCNGVSTLVVLMALEKNQAGSLYSVDYPTFTDEPAPDFQQSQYPDDHIFSAIPKDKSPGWIVPDRLRERWELRTGKSQRKLPELLFDLGEINIFIHDSDHTFPCMMFEYELAWEYLASDGLLLSDDIHVNDAFEVFGELRSTHYGDAYPEFGYALK